MSSRAIYEQSHALAGRAIEEVRRAGFVMAPEQEAEIRRGIEDGIRRAWASQVIREEFNLQVGPAARDVDRAWRRIARTLSEDTRHVGA